MAAFSQRAHNERASKRSLVQYSLFRGEQPVPLEYAILESRCRQYQAVDDRPHIHTSIGPMKGRFRWGRGDIVKFAQHGTQKGSVRFEISLVHCFEVFAEMRPVG